jgi:nucleoid DNA-binding protein
MGDEIMAKSKKALTKSAFVAHLAEKNELTKKQIEAVLDSIIDAIKDQLGTKGPGKFVFPGLARMSLIRVKAKKGGEKKINPLNKQEYTTVAKPAYNKVAIRPIKAIKEALK